jgi:hypothetical protein
VVSVHEFGPEQQTLCRLQLPFSALVAVQTKPWKLFMQQ